MGIYDVDRWIGEGGITWKQILKWHEYAMVEPFGEERADLRMGILASVIAEPNRDPKRRREPFSPKDFIPDFGRVADNTSGGDSTHTQPTPKPLDKAGWDRLKKAVREVYAAPPPKRRRPNTRAVKVPRAK